MLKFPKMLKEDVIFFLKYCEIQNELALDDLF